MLEQKKEEGDRHVRFARQRRRGNGPIFVRNQSSSHRRWTEGGKFESLAKDTGGERASLIVRETPGPLGRGGGTQLFRREKENKALSAEKKS